MQVWFNNASLRKRANSSLVVEVNEVKPAMFAKGLKTDTDIEL